MDILAVKRLAELLLRVAGKQEAALAVPMRVQKPPMGEMPESEQPLLRAAPETVGVRSAYLEEFLHAAASDVGSNLHSLTVVRRGKVILETSLQPYDRGVWHVSHSLSKTVTALAVGILLDRGVLERDTRVTEVLESKISPMGRVRYRNLTVQHLLSMTSGIGFNEISTVTQTDWQRGCFDTAPLFEPGAKFQYNSMNTYLLSALLRAKTGQTLTEFLKAHLFEPMGIRRFHFETCPLGIEKAGWGLYLLQEDMAKLGVLALNGGVWNGKRLISEAFLREMAKPQSTPPKEMSDYGYGLHAWLWVREGSFIMNGLFGQNVLVLPDLDMVVAVNAGGDRMFGKSDFLTLCEAYFGSGVSFPDSLPADWRAQKSLLKAAKEAKCPALLRPQTERGLTRIFLRHHRRSRVLERNAAVSGLSFVIAPQSARLLPIFTQLIENNFTDGISRVAFHAVGETLVCTVWEGEEKNTFAIGFSAPLAGVLRMNGEEQRIAACGRWTKNEEDIPVLLVYMALLEQSSSRRMKFFFEADGTLSLHLSETPSKDALSDGMSLVAGQGRLIGAITGAVRLDQRLAAIAEPRLKGTKTTAKEDTK